MECGWTAVGLGPPPTPRLSNHIFFGGGGGLARGTIGGVGGGAIGAVVSVGGRGGGGWGAALDRERL